MKPQILTKLPDEATLLSFGRKRIKFIAIFLLLPICLLVGRIVTLRLADATTLSFEKRTVLPAPRGQILAVDGSSLAVTLDDYIVCANPRAVADKHKMARLVASAIGGDAQKYFSLLNKTEQTDGSPNYYVRLKLHVDKDHVDRLKALMGPPEGEDETDKEKLERHKFWSALSFELNPKRQYPLTDFASQLIGMTNPAGKGITGLERGYNDALAGEDGVIISQVDAQGRPLPDFVEKWVDPQEGKSLVTTIDPVIQAQAEEALGKLMAQYKPKFASAVVMRPQTGEIVALANTPGFDLNNRPSNVIELATNNAINFAYEPGSTFKVITAAAAVENVPDWKTRTFVCNGAQRIGGFLIHCWVSSTSKGSHGVETLADGIRDSCNLTMYGFADLMGASTMLEYAKKFGVGTKADLPHLETQSGRLPFNKPADWGEAQLANFSFGQGMLMTPFQVAQLASIIANDGVLMKPLLVKQVLNSAGDVVQSYEPQPERRVIKPATAQAVKEMMVGVVSEGTASQFAAVPGYKVAGKTGSAQVADGPRGYMPGKFISSFVGFLPADDPEFVIMIMANQPQGSHWGSVVCGPAFRDIAEKAMVRLRLQEGASAPAPDPALMD